MGFAPSSGQYVRRTATIPVAGSVDIFLSSAASYKGRRIIMRLEGSGLRQFKNFDSVLIGAEIETSVYSVLGENINVTANVLIDGSDAILRLSNAEAYSVDAVIQTIKL